VSREDSKAAELETESMNR